MLNGVIPASWSGPLQAALRIMIGLLFLQRGTAKYFKFPLTEYFADGVEVFSLMGPAGAIEIIGSILIILGLFTRIIAFILACEMAVLNSGICTDEIRGRVKTAMVRKQFPNHYSHVFYHGVLNSRLDFSDAPV